MQSDATGLPRSASKARPRCERRMRCTTISDSTISTATSQKNSRSSSLMPSSDGLVSLMPIGPSVRKVISLIRIWMMVPKASVTIARYGPVTRSAGSASSAPNSAVTPIAATSVTSSGVPELEDQHAGGVGADAEQARVAERHLAGVADDDVEPEQQDRVDHDGLEQVDVVRVADAEREQPSEAAMPRAAKTLEFQIASSVRPS